MENHGQVSKNTSKTERGYRCSFSNSFKKLLGYRRRGRCYSAFIRWAIAVFDGNGQQIKPLSQSPTGTRIASVHNGSSLFTGDAGGGESNIRRYIIENDWLGSDCTIAQQLVLQYRNYHLHLDFIQQQIRQSQRQSTAY